MTVPQPHFERVAGTNLFWLTGSGRTIGFQSTPGASIGDTPLLATTWDSDAGGLYFFLGTAPASDSLFAAALPPYLQSLGWPNGPKFLWLQDPNATTWSGQTLSLTQSGTAWTVSVRADFRLVNYTLTVLGGSVVTLATEAQNWGFVFELDSIAPAILFVPGGQYQAQGGVLLPFAGAQAGCWRFSIELPNGASTPTDFTQLGVGLRFFYPDPGKPSPFIRALTLQTIVQPATPALQLDVSLDPLRATTPDRSWLSLFPLNPELPPFSSTFATAHGYEVTLTPLAASGSTPDARFVFAVHPSFSGAPGPVPFNYYLTPEGAYTLGFSSEIVSLGDTTGTTLFRLLCGASGLEYLGVQFGTASQLLFVPGKPAFAPMTPAAPPGSALTALGTTSWIWVSAATGGSVRYYAQPEDAPLYQAPEGDHLLPDLGSAYLNFLEVPALQLSPPDGVRCFPAAPYRGLPAAEIAGALAVEAAALAPVRRQAILDADFTAWAAPQRDADAPADPTTTIGVTPQGLAVGVGSDGMEWTWAGLANDTDEPAAQPSLLFTQADGAFRQALETNRLFMVAANAGTFMANASVRYQMTAEGIAEIRAKGTVPASVLTPVASYFSSHDYPVYENEALFVDALNTASSDSGPFHLVFEREAGLLMPRIGDWHFQISPRNWSNPQRAERKNAFLIYKFNLGRSLAEMTADLSSWTWPAVAVMPNGTIGDTQRELQSIYDSARASNTNSTGKRSAYANIVGVLDDPNWTGILAFSCDMPLDELPAPLQALAAGIDMTRFYAHHLGFNITPFGAEPGSLQFGKTSMFGLLDYQDPADQFFETNVDYMFKVLQLTVGFRNSVMTDFFSRVELLVNRFFGTPALLYPSDHGNNVLLDGVYQRQKDQSGVEHGTYVFSMERQNTVGLADSALRWALLLSTQLVTTQAADPADPSSKVISLFQMSGNLYFYEPPGFDPFSFGQTREEEASQLPAASSPSGLRFGNLAVRMEFTMADRTPSFSFVTETLSFDLANSTPRKKALYALFPLSLSGFLATPDPTLLGLPESEGSVQKPEASGYVSAGAPIQQSVLTDPWYGIVYAVDLGTLGALAGSVGLSLSVLVAWSGGGTRDEPTVYFGVKLPGLKESLGVELPLQGILSLGFKSIQFLASDDAVTGDRQYILRFRNFAVRFLGLAFPPGYNDILLAGNPDTTSPTKLGWYAAYSAEDDPKKKSLPSSTTRQVAARRLPPSTLAPRARR